jgi:MFS family permease
MNSPTDHSSSARPGSARAAFGHRAFRQLWLGAFASNIGTWMQNVVLPAYLYHRTGKAWVVGVVVFAQLGPLLLLSLPAGVLADRVNRRRLLISMNFVQMLCAVALFAFVASEMPLWSIVLAQLGIGTANAVAMPAYSATIPVLVGLRDLPGAISLNSVQINGSRVVGPVIAAVMALWGVTTAQFFLVNAVTYLFVIAALWRLRLPPVERTHGDTRGWRQLIVGLQIVRRRPALARLLWSLTSFSLISLPYVGLFPAVVESNVGIAARSSTYKWLYATWGTGAMLGALAMGTVLVGLDVRRVIRWGFAAFAVLLAAFALVRVPWAAFVVGFALGAAYFGTTTAMMTVFQSRVADHERGRVMSLWFMAFGGTIPLGNLIFGPVIDAVGARWVLLVGAVWAAFLAWWCDIARMERSTIAQHVDDPLHTGHP